MNVLNIIRSQEWWGHKLAPLLAIGYATALICNTSIVEIAWWLVFLFFALVIGAVYVSVLNDITDLDEDLASGKSNRIQQVNPQWRWCIPVACLLIGLLVGFIMYPDTRSCLLYSLSWVAFSLYSIKPFRLKARGILGVLADGCGSHLFPSLLIVSSVSYISHQDINWVWFTSVGIWAISYGLRGILWHQFEDRENDIKVNLNTFASKLNPADFRKKIKYLFSVEIVAFIFMLYHLPYLISVLGLLIYFILVFIRYNRYHNQIILILRSNPNQPFQILMADYYQMIFPVSLLVYSAVLNPVNLIVLACHLILFPYTFWLALYDLFFYPTLCLIRRLRR